MGEADRQVDLTPIVGAQRGVDVPPVGRRTGPNIHRHNQDRPAVHAHQLGLRERRALKVEAAIGALFDREGMVVLGKIELDPPHRRGTLVVGLREQALLVAVPFRLEEENVGNRKRPDMHRHARTTLCGMPAHLDSPRTSPKTAGSTGHGTTTRASQTDPAVTGHAARHRVKPGINGWAQVNGWRGETDTLDMIRNWVDYDLYYIDNWFVWLDFLMIAKVVMVLFRDEKGD